MGRLSEGSILPPSPYRIGITGGIGSGKSYVCHWLEEMGLPVFYCDDEAKRIIRTHPVVRQELTALVGSAVYDADGQLVKPVLAAYLCTSPEHAARVDAIVHPVVAEEFCTWADSQTARTVIMECALLFESGFDRLVHHTVHVSAPLELREKRVMARDGVTLEKVQAWMSLQMPEEEKARRADSVLHNDGSGCLDEELAQIPLEAE